MSGVLPVLLPHETVGPEGLGCVSGEEALSGPQEAIVDVLRITRGECVLLLRCESEANVGEDALLGLLGISVDALDEGGGGPRALVVVSEASTW